MNPKDELGPPAPFIRDKLYERLVIPFLGSGASLSERSNNTRWRKGSIEFLPNSDELAKHLAQLTSFPTDDSYELTEVAQYFEVVTGREPLEQELHSIFSSHCPYASLHNYLAEIPVHLLIVTTNYDNLIENAFDAASRKYDLVIHTTDPKLGDKIFWKPYGETEPFKIIPNKLDIDLDAVTVIYKMHGAVDRSDFQRDQYVITEDDYIDFLVRMNKNKAIPSIFAEPFQKCHFLFLGYSLRDWNMRVVLNRIERESRRQRGKKSWAIQHKPSPLEKRFWQDRGVEVFDLTIEQFVDKLRQVQ